jgi:hypothetical protein
VAGGNDDASMGLVTAFQQVTLHTAITALASYAAAWARPAVRFRVEIQVL